ncbi:MAG: DUF4055 domain-containing protein [Hoeflea sp.]|uniref:DUF4055 domain-containing protein n=1 Tax=Hoeflea sp. TaxID=1940281 RepID=UPI0032ECFF6A
MATASSKKQINIQDILSSYPSWVHPSVHYHAPDWSLLRDTYQGERQVKDNSVIYLPQPSGLDDADYAMYLENATYYNMTNRTVGALVGTIFRRNPVVSNLPKNLTKKLKKITLKNQSFRSFARRTAKEVVHMGRYGVLVDMPTNGGDPYLTGYITEAILDWTYEMVGDREVLTEAVLMEANLNKVEPGDTIQARRYSVRLRVLRLIDGAYEQHIYESKAEGATYPDPRGQADQVIRPTHRGKALSYIPFVIFGTESNEPDIERSSMLDIAQMNISHFRSYAHLEHGRYYTGLPVFWVSKATGEGQGEYTIGASTVWEVGPGEKAGLMEFNGQGLKFLESAISTKEAHISTLGGRLIGVTTASVSESDNQVSMKDRNEQALLLNISIALDEGFTQILEWWAIWQDVNIAKASEITIEFNKDFMLKEAAAREFRAVQQMYNDGILPIEVVYDYLKRAEVIPDWLEIEEFKKLLESSASFPNNPDVDANQRGMPDRKTEIELEETEKDRKSQEQIAESQAALELKQARSGNQPPAEE